jgi:hypothetical protein
MLIGNPYSISLAMTGQLSRTGSPELSRYWIDLDANPIAGERLALVWRQDLDNLSKPPHAIEERLIERPFADLRDLVMDPSGKRKAGASTAAWASMPNSRMFART